MTSVKIRVNSVKWLRDHFSPTANGAEVWKKGPNWKTLDHKNHHTLQW